MYEYTATAGQTTFSGSDDNSATLSYTADNLQVVMNGVVLDPSDFTATNGTSVVLASGAALNDIVNIYAFKSFTTADMVSKTAGGTFTGNVNFSGNIDVDGTTTVDGLTSSEALDVTTSTHANASVFKSTGNTQLFLQDTDASANDQFWGFQVSGGSFNILTCDDDRSGGFLTPIELTSTGVLSHSISASGDIAKFVTSANSGTGLFLNSQTANQIDIVGYDGSAANAVNIRSGGASGAGLNVNTSNQVSVGTTSPSGRAHIKSDASEIVTFVEANAGSYTGEIVYVQTTRTANTTHRYFKANENGGAATSIQILGNGNVQNANNSYTAISDERIKQDITDANSQWDDIKALQIKNYKLKYRVSVDGDDAQTHLGVVAQDLEAAGMNGLIEHLDPDPYQKDTLGIEENVKSVKYSILYMKAVKALQEAMTRIETLETKVAALEAGE